MTTWPGWTARHTLILPLDDAPPSTPVRIDGREFLPKDELHVTLVGSALGSELEATLGPRLEAATRPAFEALDWTPVRTGHAALIAKAGRTDAGARGDIASVIEFVDLPALDHWYRWLGGLLGRELPVPPAHVTLYTHACAGGIGVPTTRALRSMLRRHLQPAELGRG